MPGFDTNRFTDLNEREAKHLICSICLNIFDGAVRSGCEHTFCKSCVQQWIESNHKECPECRKKFKTRKRSDSTKSTDNSVLIGNHIFKSNLLVNSLVSDLKIKCDFDYNGCQQSVELDLLSSHVKECPHRLCPKCGLGFVEDIEHKCIELLKNDRNDFKDNYEKQLEVIEELKVKYENQLEINNKQKEEILKLKIKLESILKSLQNETNNTIAVKEVSNNVLICNSIENICFGNFNTTLESLEVHQDTFKFMSVVTDRSNSLINLKLEFKQLEQFFYCKDRSLRIVMIRPHKKFGDKIENILGLGDKNKSDYSFNVDSNFSAHRYITVDFRADTQHFERCVQIMESVNNWIKVVEMDKRVAQTYFNWANF